MAKKLTREEVISNFNNIHNYLYDYSKVVYVNNNTNILIGCPTHGYFEQLPRGHLKSGCKKCVYDSYRSDLESLIPDILKKIGSGYNFDKVEYKNSYTPVTITCLKHGDFEQKISELLLGRGCKKCRLDNKQFMNSHMFIDAAHIVHNNRYDYSKVIYTGTHKGVNIICPEHGVFIQTPNNHLRNRGCPICKNSYGESFIDNFLVKNNILFERQKRFNECVYIKPLKFDFYLPDYNLCIEYNGRQHYEPVQIFGGDVGLGKTKIRDNIKINFCESNNIKLLIIKYDEDIESVISRVCQIDNA